MPSQNEIIYTPSKQPRQVRIDSTTKCPARCLSCHKFLTKRNGEMEFGLIAEIVNDVARWAEPLIEIVPVNYGEFFMREDWLQILQLIGAKLPKTQIVLPTNGALLDMSKAKALCKISTLRIINFSINAFFDETYEKFMGLNPDILRQIEKVMRLIKVLRPDIALWASMVFDPQYCSDLERDRFIEYWREIAHPQILPAASAGRGTKILIPRVRPCRSIFSDIVVGFDRKISSCCFDADFSIDLGWYDGNLLGNWWSKEMVILREKHNEGRRQEIPLCKRCSFE